VTASTVATAEPIEWPTSTTRSNRGRSVRTTACTAFAWADTVTSVLSVRELRPLPSRSTAMVAIPALFTACRYDRDSGA
jgi:hypothetical protein